LGRNQSQLVSLQERLSTLQIERQTIAEQKAALEVEMETKETQFAQEKKLLEDIVADVQGADERALQVQQSSHQEMLAEAQKTRVRITVTTLAFSILIFN
jgi:Ni,Fe-hydrogenase III component G